MQLPDPLLDVPPLPKGPTSLVGGTVKSVDRIRNKLVVQVFAGKDMKVSFDERTHIFRDGIETTQLGIRKGDRVYVDTQLDGTHIFARNIHVQTGVHAADSSGQVLSLDTRHGLMELQDQLSAQPVTFHLDQKTSVTRNKQPVSLADIKPGSIVAVKFAPESADRGLAREVSIIAAPGMEFTFAGRVTNIDMRSGMFSLESATDNKTYDISFNRAALENQDGFGIGSQVTVVATFVASGYRADTIKITAPPQSTSRQ